MGRGWNRGVVAILILVAVGGGIVLHWEVQAAMMRRNFVGALRRGEVDSIPVILAGKVWTENELASAHVIRLIPDSFQVALEYHLYTRGDVHIPENRFSYQATITDATTGIRHLFGYPLTGPQRWRWQGIHPASAQRYIELRVPQTR